jgi:hypothetical protein
MSTDNDILYSREDIFNVIKAKVFETSFLFPASSSNYIEIYLFITGDRVRYNQLKQFKIETIKKSKC